MYQGTPQRPAQDRAPRPQQLLGISDGPQGTLETLKLMRRLARDGKKSARVRQLALLLTSDLPSKDYMGEARAIHDYVQNSIRYIKDIEGVETLHEADAILDLGCGDCDDKAILAAALLGSIGHPSRFVAIQTGRSPSFNHVYVETRVANRWVPMETTEPWPLGRGPDPKIVRDKLVVYN